MDYRQVMAIQKARENQIAKLCPDADENSGIYVFWRIDENQIRSAYVGQAKTLRKRMADHLKGYPQHIDASIKKYKFYDEETNPYGYHVEIICKCSEGELDELEVKYIKQYADNGFQLKNVSSGAQGSNRGNHINEAKPARGYRDGLAQGYKNAQKEVRKWFDKNLTYEINGKPNKNKMKSYDKFTEFLQENSEKDDENA